jgi:hypothetical protein
LQEESFVRAIKRHWQFIKIKSFALPGKGAPYFVAGFPKVRERKIGGNIGASFMSLITQRLPTAPAEVEKHSPRYDLMLDYDTKAADVYRGNKPIDTPSASAR